MKSSKYENKCADNFPLQMSLIKINNYNYNDFQKLYNFLRDYDLIHNYDYLYDLHYSLL